MLPRNLSEISHQPSLWQELAEGAPTVIGFAQLCCRALMDEPIDVDCQQFSDESKTILALAAKRGAIEIRVHRDAFDSVERFLAVCVEFEPERRWLFLRKEDPQQTVKFLDAFRELCRAGLILHHLQRDFSLSCRGFSAASKLDQADYQHLIQWGFELD